MKKLILKVILLFAICFVPITCIFLTVDGSLDPYYLRFTTPPQKSLILGISRSAHGLQPSRIDSVLQPEWPGLNIYNYSFALRASSYGPAYYESIRKKLDPGSKDGVFILEVNPWSVATFGKVPSDTLVLVGQDFFLAKMKLVNTRPNFEYMLNSFNARYWNILKREPSDFLLHDDGWFETFVMMNDDSVRNRTQRMIARYHNIKYSRISGRRVESLKQTIELLREHGSVYLFRLPIHHALRNDEDQRFPEFEKLMTDISQRYNVPYTDLYSPSDTLQYIDGDHAWKTSSKKISIEVANIILGRGRNKETN